jgi:ubiquitin carboxyl-terminal hydrolase 7
MNSMLQTLNIMGAFKKAVFQIPTNDQDDYNSVALSLQRLFYDLMKNTNPVSTNKLVKYFGWSKEDILIQHDVQEFNLHLSDVMKKKMKGTPGEGTFSNLFEGKLINYIECLNVSYKSEKIEHFCDLQLTVKVILLLII